MKRNNRQYGSPEILFRDTKANIEALTGLVGGETAHATDTGENGYYDEVAVEWVWGAGGGGGVESVSGDGVDNTDPNNPVMSYPTPGDIGAELAGAAATAETNAKSYADGLVVGLWDDRGSFDASGGAYPSSGGSGTAGAILKGDIWTISVAGTLPTGQVVEAGDIVRALVDTPGNTQANWAITQNNIGYVAENTVNKATTMTGNETSNIVYLTAKAVFDWVVSLLSVIIIGCQGLWNSATSLTVGVGFCIAENGNLIIITSPLTASSLSLSTNTEYHVYVYLSGGSPAMEVSTTAPVLWKGTAYSKTGDTSRRYMYSIRTATASGNVRKFVHNWVTNKIFYVSDNMAATPYRVLSNGKATTSTAVSLSGIVPATAIVGFARFANVDSTYVSYIGIDAVSSSSYDNYFNAGLRATLEFAVASQNIYYFYDGGTPTNGLYIDILGYSFKR